MDAVYDGGAALFCIPDVVVFSEALGVGGTRGVVDSLVLLMRSPRSRILLSSRLRRRY